jgi:hypothetical protein
MPVIRSQPEDSQKLKAELREQILQELSGGSVPQPPIIYEIPLQPSDTLHVIVVWDKWADVPAQDRADLIMQAYQEFDSLHPEVNPKAPSITLVMGTTWQEADRLGVLPYVIEPNYRRGEADDRQVLQAMLKQGGVETPSGKVILRFATESAADIALRSLKRELPDARWSLGELNYSSSSSSAAFD